MRRDVATNIAPAACSATPTLPSNRLQVRGNLQVGVPSEERAEDQPD